MTSSYPRCADQTRMTHGSTVPGSETDDEAPPTERDFAPETLRGGRLMLELLRIRAVQAVGG